MSQKIQWLECKASEGQFQDELAVRGKDFRDEEFSFFVGRDFVKHDAQDPIINEVDAFLKVTTIDHSGNLMLVLLPGLTFGNGSVITVKMEDLKECKECEPSY